jgi:uncharacterized protein YbjT (DUF2867 family)
MTVLVTGARGHVGRAVLDGLLTRGQRVRASSRDARTLDLDGVEKVSLDLENPGTIGHALDGVRALFTYTRPQGMDGFFKAARQAGVEHVVLLSSSAVIEPDAKSNPIALVHRAVEQSLEDSGLPFTILHPWAFATNALDWAEEIRSSSTVSVPYPDARLGAIHQGDIGNVAATVLADGSHQGEALSLTGPEPITFRDQVAVLADLLGRPVSVRELEPAEARERTPIPAPAFDAILRAWARAVDEPAPVTDTVTAVTGTPARTFRQWAADHRAEFS